MGSFFWLSVICADGRFPWFNTKYATQHIYPAGREVPSLNLEVKDVFHFLLEDIYMSSYHFFYWKIKSKKRWAHSVTLLLFIKFASWYIYIIQYHLRSLLSLSLALRCYNQFLGDKIEYRSDKFSMFI
jgi:hypothetical protein